MLRDRKRCYTKECSWAQGILPHHQAEAAEYQNT
jgi:hypothetical protein